MYTQSHVYLIICILNHTSICALPLLLDGRKGHGTPQSVLINELCHIVEIKKKSLRTISTYVFFWFSGFQFTWSLPRAFARKQTHNIIFG